MCPMKMALSGLRGRTAQRFSFSFTSEMKAENRIEKFSRYVWASQGKEKNTYVAEENQKRICRIKLYAGRGENRAHIIFSR